MGAELIGGQADIGGVFAHRAGAPTTTVFMTENRFYAVDAQGRVRFHGTDPATVIQAAINVGGKLFLKAGTYDINRRLEGITGLVLHGEGVRTIIRATGAMNSQLRFNACHDFEVKDIFFDGNGNATFGLSLEGGTQYAIVESISGQGHITSVFNLAANVANDFILLAEVFGYTGVSEVLFVYNKGGALYHLIPATSIGVNGVKIYNGGQSCSAYYGEVTTLATVAGVAYQAELRQAALGIGNQFGLNVIQAELSTGIKTRSSPKSGGIGINVSNAHAAVPSAPYIGVLIADEQQAGSPNNVLLDLRLYQDITAMLLRDNQRANATVASMQKNAAGGQLSVYNSLGNERATMKEGTAGNRGVLKMWDATAGAFRYAYIDAGAWVIAAGEPT